MAIGTLLLAACAGVNDLGSYTDLRWKLQSFYQDHAWEEGARCVLPSMSITQWKVVEETPEKIVMDVRYAWRVQNDGGRSRSRTSGGGGTCSGFNERRFTIVKSRDGLQIESMTGEQR